MLVGMMGAGKTTVGMSVAAALGWAYLDNDDLVLEAAGEAKATLLAGSGEVSLRTAESAALQRVLTRPGPLVAGLAGGVVLDPGNIERLRSRPPGSLLVWLRAPIALLAERISRDPQDRPWLGTDLSASLVALASEREPHYRELADLIVDVDLVPLKTITAEIVARCL